MSGDDPESDRDDAEHDVSEEGQSGDGQPAAGGSDDNWVSDSVDDAAGSGGGGGRPTDTGRDDQSANGGRSATGEKGPGEKFCAECGAVINEQAEICPECGVRQPGMGSGSDDERLIAALLAIFLGGIGAHKFYLGKNGQGLLYLCFFWTAIPALLGIIEGIIYLTKSDEEFREQYMQD
ncbi:TM2 domain-containing protein [Halosimplex amylolyticum]|uniref:TM2 domain-containing protein n=1 Tax=Halosimplex amylolyticum TaxID=3396616 RepID=UPI003F5732CE